MYVQMMLSDEGYFECLVNDVTCAFVSHQN